MDSEFVLGVDIDGVLGDHTGAFRRFVAAHREVEADSLPLERSWDFHEWGLEPGEYDLLHRAAVLDHRMFRDMDVMEGAARALWRLSDAGVWIRIITHRLYVNWGHQVAVSDTVEWLDRHQIPYRDICFLGAKPEVEADLYVDDAPHNVLALRAAGNRVVIFDQPYNRDLDGDRVRSWAEMEDVVAVAAAQSGHSLQGPLPGLDPDLERHRRITGA